MVPMPLLLALQQAAMSRRFAECLDWQKG